MRYSEQGPATDALTWQQSPWDNKCHAFPALAAVTAEALCEHSAPTTRLVDPLPGAGHCLACLLLHGDQLADQHGLESV